MKVWKIGAVILAATLGACGGGGGGESPGTNTGNTGGNTGGTGGTTSVSCPDGKAAASASACAAVTANVSALQGTTQNPTLFNQGVVIQFNGSLDPSKTVETWKQGGIGITTTLATSITNNVTTLTVVPTMRVAYGADEVLTIDAIDSVGRPVEVTLSFKTSAMTCTSNSVWSNPANFVAAYGDCVAPIGVQALMSTAANTMTDTSCTFAAGVLWTDACKAYAANGTLLFADTSIVVQNDQVVWIAYYGKDGASNLVLLDATTKKVVGTVVLSSQLSWIIGNPTGAAIALSNGKRYQARWDGAAIAVACTVGC